MVLGDFGSVKVVGRPTRKFDESSGVQKAAALDKSPSLQLTQRWLASLRTVRKQTSCSFQTKEELKPYLPAEQGPKSEEMFRAKSRQNLDWPPILPTSNNLQGTGCRQTLLLAETLLCSSFLPAPARLGSHIRQPRFSANSARALGPSSNKAAVQNMH